MRGGWGGRAGGGFITIEREQWGSFGIDGQEICAADPKGDILCTGSRPARGASNIGSSHILSGLLVEEFTRVNRLFHLSERLPEVTVRIRALTKFPQPRDIPLAKESKRILAQAAVEANRLNDYWIDTDHLMLGILCQESSVGAALIHGGGVEINGAREFIARNVPREDFGPEPSLWWLEKPITRSW